MKRIVVIGLGLIGGSLAAAAKKKFPRARIIGVTRNKAALASAKRKGWIHEGFTDLKKAFSNHDHAIIILCTPVDTLKNYLLKLDRLAPSGTVVTDAGSVKGFLARWAERQKWRSIQFVGAHPMAGSHERGIRHARPDLFNQALTFVTPGRKGTQTVVNFWRKICRRVVLISPKSHDRITAEISHLPHLIAFLLVENVSPSSLRFAASGFLDTTRVAQADPDIWLPIFAENKKELLRTLHHFESRLKNMRKILQGKELAKLRGVLVRAQRRRRKIE